MVESLQPFIFTLQSVESILNTVMLICITIVTIYFSWNAVTTITSSSSENAEERKSKFNRLLFSIIALFLLVSLWGIIFFLRNIMGVGGGGLGYSGGYGYYIEFSPGTVR